MGRLSSDFGAGRMLVAQWCKEMAFMSAGQARTGVRPTEVEHEAWRRKGLLRLDEWQLREYVSGKPVPEAVSHMCRQIDLAAEALIRMSAIPADYADDLYWPLQW